VNHFHAKSKRARLKHSLSRKARQGAKLAKKNLGGLGVKYLCHHDEGFDLVNRQTTYDT
jgi:hypothetical protein